MAIPAISSNVCEHGIGYGQKYSVLVSLDESREKSLPIISVYIASLS